MISLSTWRRLAMGGFLVLGFLILGTVPGMVGRVSWMGGAVNGQGTAHAQGIARAQEGAGPGIVEIVPEVKALLNGEPKERWDSLAALRNDLQAARLFLLAALAGDNPVPHRWRAVYHLTEFGTREDVPTLLALLKDNEDSWERKVILGAVKALYESREAMVELTGLVSEFSFVQTKSARRVPDKNDGLWMLSNWSFIQLHRSDIEYAVVKNLIGIRRKGFSKKDDLEQVMKKRLNRRQWKEYHERLMGMVEQISSSAALDGLARVRLRNPLDRPLLMEVTLGVWYGHFSEPVPPYFVYLEPGGEGGVDIPVKPVGELGRETMRLDLRLREVNGAFVPAFSKVYLPLRP